MLSIAEEIGNAQLPREKTPKFWPGNYPLLYIEQFKEVTSSRDGKKYIAIDLAILESDVYDRPAGTRVSYLWNLSHPIARKYSISEILHLVGVALNIPKDDIKSVVTAEMFAEVVEKDELIGRLVTAKANLRSNDKGEFVNVAFGPANPEDQDQAAEAYNALFG